MENRHKKDKTFLKKVLHALMLEISDAMSYGNREQLKYQLVQFYEKKTIFGNTDRHSNLIEKVFLHIRTIYKLEQTKVENCKIVSNLIHKKLVNSKFEYFSHRRRHLIFHTLSFM